jgi:hypothetical protein
MSIEACWQILAAVVVLNTDGGAGVGDARVDFAPTIDSFGSEPTCKATEEGDRWLPCAV